jgi:twitching motility protein PilT
MRDLDTIQTTLTMAETGHLVLGTLHTNDTSQAVDRLVDVFPTGRQAQIRVQLANSLTGIIYQQLLPKVGGGQVAAFEVLVATHATRSLIRDGKSNQLRNVLLTAQGEGMQTLESALSDLVSRGLVTYDDAVGRSLYPKELPKPAATPAQV